MTELRYTLLCDGSSDKALLPIITWTLREQGVSSAIQSSWADLSRLQRPPKKLADRIAVTLQYYPCDLLCIHRDAERESHATRYAEIIEALSIVTGQTSPQTSFVPIVPVRMHEAWLLFNEAAIRQASGNPNGRHPLNLPRIADCEGMPDPKEALNGAVRTASGLRGRRLHGLEVSTQRIADLIDDFAPLRRLPAFLAFEEDLKRVITEQGWVYW